MCKGWGACCTLVHLLTAAYLCVHRGLECVCGVRVSIVQFVSVELKDEVCCLCANCYVSDKVSFVCMYTCT